MDATKLDDVFVSYAKQCMELLIRIAPTARITTAGRLISTEKNMVFTNGKHYNFIWTNVNHQANNLLVGADIWRLSGNLSAVNGEYVTMLWSSNQNLVVTPGQNVYMNVTISGSAQGVNASDIFIELTSSTITSGLLLVVPASGANKVTTYSFSVPIINNTFALNYRITGPNVANTAYLGIDISMIISRNEAIQDESALLQWNGTTNAPVDKGATWSDVMGLQAKTSAIDGDFSVLGYVNNLINDVDQGWELIMSILKKLHNDGSLEFSLFPAGTAGIDPMWYGKDGASLLFTRLSEDGFAALLTRNGPMYNSSTSTQISKANMMKVVCYVEQWIKLLLSSFKYGQMEVVDAVSLAMKEHFYVYS